MRTATPSYDPDEPVQDLPQRKTPEIMNIVALVLALLRIPVAALELLPAYHAEALFMVFYASFVWVLTLDFLL